jgi:hypothetical protein
MRLKHSSCYWWLCARMEGFYPSLAMSSSIRWKDLYLENWLKKWGFHRYSGGKDQNAPRVDGEPQECVTWCDVAACDHHLEVCLFILGKNISLGRTRKEGWKICKAQGLILKHLQHFKSHVLTVHGMQRIAGPVDDRSMVSPCSMKRLMSLAASEVAGRQE